MQFRTLENIGTEALLTAFNLAFSDYIIPMWLTATQLEAKLASEDIDLKLSAGAFEGDTLCGFVLHGYREIDGVQTIYNGGTGVIPDQRGQQITSKLYDFILPRCRELNITKCLLEVIVGNLPAIKTYERMGFSTTREFQCYKGKPTHTPPKNFNIAEGQTPDWALFQSFWDFKPSWQNSIEAIDNSWSQIKIITLLNRDETLGYAIYNPETARIHQLAVAPEHRRHGFGTALFQYINGDTTSILSVINVDTRSAATIHFYDQLGLDPYIGQYEMELSL